MNELIQEGLSVVALGMGAVFIFLGLLVVVTTLMSKLVIRWVGEPTAPTSKPLPPVSMPGVAQTDKDKHLVAVIAAALHQHRSRHK